MSLAQPPAQERRPSPSTLELGTNNPFRARLSGVPSPTTTDNYFGSQGPSRERPKSRNPFLDVFDDESNGDFGFDNNQQGIHRANSFDATNGQRNQLTGSAAELFENLTLADSKPAPPASMNRPPPPRPPPQGSHHHKSRSVLDDAPLISINSFPVEGSRPPPPGARRPPPPNGRGPPPPSGGDRSRGAPRPRPRRNSDSSVIDAHENEARDRSRRERERGERSHRDKDGKLRPDAGSKSRREPSSDRRKKNSALDVIDKLDVTGIYGSGLFHHDGPFDACNPHRNKNSRRLAPVQAFPADSANNSMTGFGPLNEKADHSHIFGNRGDEAYHDYTASARPMGKRAASFDPKSAVETLHGDESLGLGTSTFLDGAPASRAAIAKNIEFEERPRSGSEGAMGGGGLQRKKSLAQKIRSIKPSGEGRRRAPPPPPGAQRSPPEGRSPTTPQETRDGYFGNDYDDAYDRKGENIARNAPSSPKHPGVVRAGTDDGQGSGLLKRVRSLSKPKRRD
ncbi:Pal1 cell morphology protein-domain-containing protein [Pyronema omphalodes]|nr:Pal1 cell morphology protein-domain-containing protein [Pyronema omphalodes]